MEITDKSNGGGGYISVPLRMRMWRDGAKATEGKKWKIDFERAEG